MRKQKQPKATIDNKLRPIIFQNKPIEEDEKDIFDFTYQKDVLNQAIDSGARIIGVIGDYGTGKSSVTKLLEKDRNKKEDTVININLWGNFSSNQDSNNSLIKSFLFQLAYANKAKNHHFAKYVNARFNKNNGKVGFAIATKGTYFLLIFSLFLFGVFFTFNSLGSIKEVVLDNWFLSFLSKTRYFSFSVGLFLVIIGISIAAPVFSSWKSEGQYTPGDSDIYDIYLKIINRITKKVKKCIVLVDDLDRASEKNDVLNFLKEIYKCVHLLPLETQNKIVFIISLKSETSFDVDNENPDLKNLYSKVFDYTQNIKTIHNENYRAVVQELLNQEKDSICLLGRKILGDSIKDESIISTFLNELKWIYSDENLTIREIKERLNETFSLYQTLFERKFENPSVELRKCAAVVFLKRKYEKEYNLILSNELAFAEFIRKCKKDKNCLDSEIKSAVFLDSMEFVLTNILKEMILNDVIEDDFSMYFYSYPKGSYIKSVSEKEVFDALIHDNEVFYWNDDFEEKIDETVNRKQGKAIDEAFEKYLSDSVPSMIYKNQTLFSYIVNNHRKQRIIIEKEIKKEIDDFLEDEANPFEKIKAVLKFDYNINLKQKFISEINTYFIEEMKVLKSNEIENNRLEIINNFSDFLSNLLPIFTTEELPLLTKDEFDNIENESVKEEIIKSLSDKRLEEFDNLGIQLENINVENYLFGRQKITSLLVSYIEQDRIENFNFKEGWVKSQLMISLPIIAEININDFIKIRDKIGIEYLDNLEDFSDFYFDEFPIIELEELRRIPVEKFNEFVDYKKINTDNANILSEYCNFQELHGEKLYLFFENTFIENDIISDVNLIKNIFENIDFQKIKFNSMSQEQQSYVFEFFKKIYKLDTMKGSFEFMIIVNCLIEQFENEYISEIKKTDETFNEYLDLINTLKSATQTTLEIIKDQKLRKPLVPEITTFLKKNKYYLRYIIGKTLYERELFYEKDIPLEKYYSIFKTSDECLENFKNNDEIIDMFYNNKMYLDETTPSERYVVFYKKRQSIDLVKIILEKLSGNKDKQVEYLFQITDLDTKDDASKFIELITKKEYIELLKQSELFYYLWYKMWTVPQKIKFTKTVNQKLGTSYNASEAHTM